MSASTTPTLRPLAASAAARLTVTEDLPTPPLQVAALVITHHVELDPHARHTRHPGHRVGDILGDLVFQRTPRDREPDVHPHGTAGRDRDILDHPEFGDRAAYVGVEHLAKGLSHLLDGGR